MKTAKEFLERISADQAFAEQVNAAILAKKDAGAKDYTEALLPVAAELGYEITAEQVEALREKASESISEEELGKAAGGTSCFGAVMVATGLAQLAASIAVTADSSSC